MAKTLTVFLAADLKKFNGGMKDARREVDGFGGSLKNKLGPAFIAAGAAAGAFAVKLAVDGVKAAMEDQAAVAALATTLDNLKLSHDTEEIEAFIYQLERAYGVADTELRPAYDRLVRSTKDTEEANRALKIAMDISASTGKSLQTVTDALGRAYDGNTVSLGRLGLGIDKTALASMSLDDIMSTLAATFAGQADANAQTFEGQLRRLTTATDNLKEAFGAGLLESLGDTDRTTQSLVDAMEKLEVIIKRTGETVGDTASFYADLVGLASDMTQSFGVSEQGFNDFVTALIFGTDDAAQALRTLRGEAASLQAQLSGTFETMGGGDFTPNYEALNFELKAANQLYQDAAARAQRLANEQTEVADRTTSVARQTSGARRETDQLTKSQTKLIEAYELQGIAFQTSKTELMDQIGALEEATAAVENYANAIQQDLLGGLDLMGAYAAAQEGGGDLSTGLIDGFQAQIDQADWFGNVLNALKAANIDQGLIEYLASEGPAAGGALGQALLDDRGLLGTINDQWAGIQARTKELALGLVPEFLLSGQESAVKFTKGALETFLEEQRKFKRLGNKLGQQVGSEFKARALKEIADAVKQVEAIATAGRAEAVARAEAEQARITEQAVATAISNLIRNSDQRAGRNVQPVLQ
jgi:hypothetical protein